MSLLRLAKKLECPTSTEREENTNEERRKLHNKSVPSKKIEKRLIQIEHDICASHLSEKVHDENVAIVKIKSDPNYFFRFAKKTSMCSFEIGSLMNQVTETLTNDKQAMCELLLDHFNSVFTTPNSNKIVNNPITFFSIEELTNDQLPLLTDINFSESLISEAIKELSANSTAGPDGRPASLPINCCAELTPILAIIFKESFTKGVIPMLFKRAAIVPIFMSGDKTQAYNYRPISLTSVVCKVFERVIRKQVLSYLFEHNFLNKTQHGFRGERSCLLALLDAYDDIMHMISGGDIVDMVYLDFSKAFDKVDHGILLHKLKALGITGKLGVWFYNFLTHRTHCVRLPGAVSQDHPVLSGVSQGTVLGPLLFLITIADINKDISNSKLISFADDTRVYGKISDSNDCDSFQCDLNVIYKWAIDNNMFFNAQRFNYLCFNPSISSNKCNVYINPKYDIIPYSENVLDLGITMSSNCSFDAHINQLSKKSKNLAGWILRTFITRDRLTMLTLFKAIVLSRLDYASQFWSPSKIYQINLIEKVQRSFTKHITGMHDLSYNERLKALKLYSLQRRRERYCIIYV